ERIVAWVAALVLEQQLDELVEIDLVFGDHAADRRGERGVERGETRVAAKDAKDADALVRADRGALALDRVAGAADRRREADAVLGVAHIVVHRLRDGDDLEAETVELGRVAQRVVAADG